jgi:prephenate dehydrogenase
MTTEELLVWLSVAFRKTLAERLDPRVASACATLAKAILETQAAAAQPAVEDLQAQLDALRAMVERQGRAA